MVTWQSGIDGNREVGCVAVFVSEKSSFENKVQRDEYGNLEKVIMSGRGGREKYQGKYVYVTNQEHYKNYPMFVSAEHSLPIRLVLEDMQGEITYQGLWSCAGYTYSPHNNSGGFNIFQFMLLPWNAQHSIQD